MGIEKLGGAWRRGYIVGTTTCRLRLVNFPLETLCYAYSIPVKIHMPHPIDVYGLTVALKALVGGREIPRLCIHQF